MPIGPIPNQDYHHHRHHAPPPYLTRKLLLFFAKPIITVAVVLNFVFFMGFAARSLFCSLFLSNTLSKRRCTLLSRRHNAVANRGLPAVGYSASAFPGISNCAICLDAFGEGDECRNLRVCKHLFHSKCVDMWIGKKPTCPVCRVRVDLDPVSRVGGVDRRDSLWTIGFD